MTAVLLATAAGLCVIGCLALVAALLEARDLRVTSLALRSACVPAECPGVRLVHLSDLHVPGSAIRALEAVEVVNGLRPDVVVITGDTAFPGDDWPAIAEALGSVRAPHGVFIVWGNAEHLAPQKRWPGRWLPSRSGPSTDPAVTAQLARLQEVAASKGLRVLRNTAHVVRIKGVQLALAGVDDPVTESDDVAGALGDLPGDVCTILLSHSPMVWRRGGLERVDLILAGHTHGGQVRLPLYGPLWAHSWAERQVMSGLFALERTGRGRPRTLYGHRQVLDGGHLQWESAGDGGLMYVSRGIGTVIAPLRLGCPPELVCIDLLPPVATGTGGD